MQHTGEEETCNTRAGGPQAGRQASWLACCKEAVTWTQGQETSTIHLFHNWRTLINGIGKRVEPIDTGLPDLESDANWHNKYRAAGRTVCGVAAIKSRLISRPVRSSGAVVAAVAAETTLLPAWACHPLA